MVKTDKPAILDIPGFFEFLYFDVEELMTVSNFHSYRSIYSNKPHNTISPNSQDDDIMDDLQYERCLQTCNLEYLYDSDAAERCKQTRCGPSRFVSSEDIDEV
jgi:hypothetical protein